MTTLIIFAAFCGAMSLLSFVFPREVNRWIAVAGLLLAGIFTFLGWGTTYSDFGGLYQFDTLARGLTLVALVGGLWTLLAGPSKKFEYPLVVLYAVAGIHVMSSTPSLPVMLIALEVFSLPLYLLATWQRNERGFEAGLKYFLLGAIGAAFFLFGMTMYYGATNTFNAGVQGTGPIYLVGILMMLVALGFKASMVPFQWWTPDVYQGSPTVVTMFMATAVKAAAFAALLRIFTPAGLESWGIVLAVIIALTTIFGNLGALSQTEAKRLFAYSSIAHAGYVALGLYGEAGRAAIPFYLLTYALATGVIFWILSTLSNQDVPLERLKGLFQRRPVQAVAMGVSILSLLGIPPLAGFWGKYLVFAEAGKAGYYPLLVIALLTSAISAYYYFKVFFSLFAKSSHENFEADKLVEAAVTRYGSSESMGTVDLPGIVHENTTALMAPADRKGLGLIGMWAALGLLAVLSIFPSIGFDKFRLGLPAMASASALKTPFSIGFPADGSIQVLDGFQLRGTGVPGATVQLSDNGTNLQTVQVDGGGNWSSNFATGALSNGRHDFSGQISGSGQIQNTGVDLFTPVGKFGFGAPVGGLEVSPRGFNLKGYGLPGTSLEVFEDKNSLGRITVPANGLWSLNVPPASSGKHIYELRASGENPVQLELNVGQIEAGQKCELPFSLSNLNEGGVVSRPFRFGGVGQSNSYTVTVKRGADIIGNKEVKLSGACGWSYQSNPGKGDITYEVRETGVIGGGEPLSTVTLNVQ